jgi:hypothetical protein
VRSWLAASASVAGFVWLFWVMRLSDRGREAMTTVRSSMQTMRDADLEDIAKEKAIQAYAKRLMKLFLWLLAGGLFCVTCPLIFVLMLDVIGWVVFDDVLARLVSLPFLVVAGAASVVLFVALERHGV